MVEDYILAYNKFDVPGMVSYLHEDMLFQNISQGKVTLELKGRNSFTRQAYQAVNLFKKREIIITDVSFEKEDMIVKIDYNGILGVDVPDGPKKGDKIELKGQSVFQFKEGKISSIKEALSKTWGFLKLMF
ncbi:MAG: nuclear transport factor 2 family protein [Euryarchaeota archaeon]|nr:nuclear transport factor 2 family protein [Euryarchaeota archaeon]MBU4607354.1 nuclear transport factor 2 family protein [Euryarchaeota archaeon]